jgi:hypothetical protein
VAVVVVAGERGAAVRAVRGRSGVLHATATVRTVPPVSARRSVSRLAGPALSALVVAVAAGCGSNGGESQDGQAADTARFTYGARTAEVPLADCGREGDVVVLGGSRGDVVIQAQADVGEGGFDRTGVTADLGDEGIVGAFGAETEHGPAGEITDVRIEGDQLIVEGRWVTFDDQLEAQPAAADDALDGRLVARCPDDEDEAASAH